MQTLGDDEKEPSREDNKSDSATQQTRRELALIVTSLVGIIALVAVFQSGAMPVLDKVLPIVTLAFGFFFGQRAARL